jgi:hypothetical protein
MKTDHLVDDELLSYLDLTSTDPLVRRLCEIVITQSTIRRIELEDQLSEAEEDAEYYKDLYNDSRSEVRQLERQNQLLREKLDMWNIMNNTNLT